MLNIKGDQVNLDMKYRVIITMTNHVVSPGCYWVCHIRFMIGKGAVCSSDACWKKCPSYPCRVINKYFSLLSHIYYLFNNRLDHWERLISMLISLFCPFAVCLFATHCGENMKTICNTNCSLLATRWTMASSMHSGGEWWRKSMKIIIISVHFRHTQKLVVMKEISICWMDNH